MSKVLWTSFRRSLLSYRRFRSCPLEEDAANLLFVDVHLYRCPSVQMDIDKNTGWEMKNSVLHAVAFLTMLPLLGSAPAWISVGYARGSHSTCRLATCRAPPLFGLRMSSKEELKRLAFEASQQRSLASQRDVEVTSPRKTMLALRRILPFSSEYSNSD